MAIGLVIGYLSNRLRGPYFVLATIAFSQVLLIAGSRWRAFTAGSEGIPVPFRPGFWTLGIADKRVWVAIALAFAVLAWLVQLYLDRSRRGYQLVAVREDEDAALSLGVPARWLKVAAICVSAALTAACGALWAQYIGFVDPFYVFSVDLSVRFALAAIIGGLGTALGPFLGAALVTTVETFLRAHFGGIGAGLVGIYLIVYGVRAHGHGAVGARRASWAGSGSGYAGASSRGARHEPPVRGRRLQALRGDRRQPLHLVRGGAGRAGRDHRAERRGQVDPLRDHHRLLPSRRGRGPARRDAAHRPRARMPSAAAASRARSRSCGRFRGSPCSTTSWSAPSPARRDVRHARERARALVGQVGLADKAEAHARTLSTGQRKRLELARALATEPRVLLLDEVTGGVDQRTIPELVRLVRDLHARGLTLLVIEHNMRVITAVAQRIIALHLGEVIADGPPDAVSRATAG